MDLRPLDRNESRQVDRRAMEGYGVPGIVLMENAGRGIADVLDALGITGKVVVCCGRGNNAGDGFVLARHLDLRGHAVEVLVWADPDELTGDAAVNYRIARQLRLPIEVAPADFDTAWLDARLARAEWLVDALLGTGARGEPRPPLDRVIDRFNAAPGKKLAIDLPSGLDCDTGEAAAHTVRADHTVTMFSRKRGFLAPGAERYTGRVHVIDIGVPPRIMDE